MAKINLQKIVMAIVLVIVAFIVVFTIVASTAPDLQGAANNITSGVVIGSGNTSTTVTLPLANLFGANGVLILVFMVAIFIGMLVLAFKFMGKSK
jgi:hypothetical protein